MDLPTGIQKESNNDLKAQKGKHTHTHTQICTVYVFLKIKLYCINKDFPIPEKRQFTWTGFAAVNIKKKAEKNRFIHSQL